MKNEEKIKNYNLYNKRNTQDYIFRFLRSHLKEFPEYISGYTDIKQQKPTDQINEKFEKSEMDSYLSEKMENMWI